MKKFTMTKATKILFKKQHINPSIILGLAREAQNKNCDREYYAGLDTAGRDTFNVLTSSRWTLCISAVLGEVETFEVWGAKRAA